MLAEQDHPGHHASRDDQAGGGAPGPAPVAPGTCPGWMRRLAEATGLFRPCAWEALVLPGAVMARRSERRGLAVRRWPAGREPACRVLYRPRVRLPRARDGHRGGERRRPGEQGLPGTEVSNDLRGGGALPGVLGQAALDQRAELGREPADVGRVVNDPVQQRLDRPGAERPLPCRRERQDRAEAEDIAGGVGWHASGLLRGHEPGRADHPASAGEPSGIHRAGDAEVDDPGAVSGQHDVRRLQVAVHNARGVDRLQPLGQPGGERPRLGGRHRPAAGNGVRERRALHVGGHQPWLPRVRVGVHDRDSEDAADGARRGHLLRETGPEVGVVS